METRLQSNEIRIPKPEFSVKTSRGSDSLNTSTGSNSSSNSHHYFKSSFARSLSTFASSPQSKSLSLDFAINYGFNGEGAEDSSQYPNNHCSPLSMPPIYSHIEQRFGDEEEVAQDQRDCGKQEQSCESLVSSSSMATVRNVDVWTGAQVCELSF